MGANGIIPRFLQRLMPEVPRRLPWADRLELPLRVVHIAAMAVVLGATPYVSDRRALRFAILPMVASGLALLGCELARSAAFFLQTRGVLTLAKFALITLGALLPASRFAWYLAATALAVLGAHLPESAKTRVLWRHSLRLAKDAEPA